MNNVFQNKAINLSRESKHDPGWSLIPVERFRMLVPAFAWEMNPLGSTADKKHDFCDFPTIF